MKILYGVVGEGMGHAMRSRVVIRYLLDQGHTISVMASGRAVEFLTKHFGSVKRIHGLHMIYDEGQVSRSKTLWSNAVTGASGLPRNVAAYFEMLGNFEPDLVVSDFESWTYLYGRTHRLPIVSIDNMQIINRCKHDKTVLAGEKASFRFTRAFIKAKLPGCNHYVITTFFRPPVRKKRTTLVAPILRPEIVAANRRSGDHLLVYQTGEGNQALEAALRESGMECRIYGLRRGIEEDQVEDNLRYRPFSEEGFIDDLASSRAVVSGGGFTLMGEAVFLRKPMLSVPLKGQFEQVLNARYLEAEGYGLAAPAIDAPTLRRFLDRLPELEDNLADYKQDHNRELQTTLDGLLDRAEAGVL